MQVEFLVAYKNGMIGIDAKVGQVMSLSKKEIDQIRGDMRNPDDGMKVLGGKKKDKPPDAQS